MKNQEKPLEINRFGSAGRLGPGIWLVKSRKIPFFENYFPGKSGKSEKIHPIAPRAGSAQLGPARAGSAQLIFSRNAQGLKKSISGRGPMPNFFWIDGFEVADCGSL